MKSLPNFKDIPYAKLSGKRVMCREDLNVPTEKTSTGLLKVTSDAKIKAITSNIKPLLEVGAKVSILSHFGRPSDNSNPADYSISFLRDYLEKELGVPVIFCDSYLTNDPEYSEDSVILFENVRLNKGETSNDAKLVKRYGELCDFFIFNAFASAHRSHSSTEALIKCAQASYAGPLLKREVFTLDNFLRTPKPPLIAIIGGAKISTKINLINNYLKIADQIIVGGGIANTFLAAMGVDVGKSLVDEDFIDDAKKLLEKDTLKRIVIPNDFIVASDIDTREARQVADNQISANDMILDVGSRSIERYQQIIKRASSILWNGPLGVIEKELFSIGTRKLADAIKDSVAFTIAGGGETLYAIERFNVGHSINFMSTGGGAFLEFIEGKELPSITAFKQ